jgi:hypothetical protein
LCGVVVSDIGVAAEGAGGGALGAPSLLIGTTCQAQMAWEDGHEAIAREQSRLRHQ